jgi:hypothetical protein
MTCMHAADADREVSGHSFLSVYEKFDSSPPSPDPSPVEPVCFNAQEAMPLGFTPDTRGVPSGREGPTFASNPAEGLRQSGSGPTPGLPPKRLSGALAQAIVSPCGSPPSAVLSGRLLALEADKFLAPFIVILHARPTYSPQTERSLGHGVGGCFWGPL